MPQACGFESHYPHQSKRGGISLLFFAVKQTQDLRLFSPEEVPFYRYILLTLVGLTL